MSFKSPAWLLGAAIVSLCLAGTTMAQKPAGAGPPPNNNPNLDDRIRQLDEGRLRGAETNVSVEEQNQKRLQAAIVNMRDDYKRIQILRNDIARNLVARKPLDYKLVAEQTAEINKRSTRLNIYMQARVPDEEKPTSAELKNEEMVGALVKLCKLIDSFTENPALKNAATVDSKDIAKSKEDKASADRDLVAIIKLSAGIQKKSGSLIVSQ
ncbi:MAG TPA: hypothetical protein DC054_19365 [Blastocatellia bacterium]|nr:hypothetical protein [Blastocatellia bacterium]